jgi:exopolysaccharide biosynthesis WecB/TagA/CpsF family protein
MGKIPFCSSYAMFSPGRNWEQIRTTICYNDVPVKIAGSHDGTGSIADEKDIIEIIKRSDADILLVGLGTPAQEKWLARNLSKTGCKIGIGLGGTFDFIAGNQKRAVFGLQTLTGPWRNSSRKKSPRLGRNGGTNIAFPMSNI